MRRRDVIQALCGLLGVSTLATRRVRAAAPRQISACTRRVIYRAGNRTV